MRRVSVMENEMLENLDLLLNMDELEQEDIWDESLHDKSVFPIEKDEKDKK
jgi:hypothetical protein